MKKHKPCKGINKARGYKGCEKMVEAATRTYGLCRSCYAKWLLNTPEGKAKLERASLRASKSRRDLDHAKQEKKRREGLTTLLKSVKDVCHKYIRLRDRGKPCISCGHPWHDQHEAGHYYKAELYSSLRFNEDNIHGQCIRCNRMKDGNLNNYQLNIVHRIGESGEITLTMLALNERRNGFKWDREELKRIRKYYNDKIKELQQ